MRVFEQHQLPYTADDLRCKMNHAALEYFLEICLAPASSQDPTGHDHMNSSLEKLRKLLCKFCTTLHMDVADQTSPSNAIRMVSNILSTILTTEDLSVRRSAERFTNRVSREVTSFLKNRTA
uniref:Uncharacterized protein n=1 Tax=Globisporangium ultimum (strain ATCC 200006 / CBS 805.95 / DAOM BR144) TaxID=431595 RepID=K3WVQ0_GLOUD